MSKTLSLALLQHACTPDPTENLTTVTDMIRRAADRGAELIVTQELFRTPYFCDREDPDHFNLAEPIPGPTSQTLAALAAELSVSISASLFERRAPGLYHNTSILLDPAGQIIGKYRKNHIPDDPSYLEKYYFTPGDLGYVAPPLPPSAPADPAAPQAGPSATKDLEDAPRIGLLVCWDQWFPEAARLTAMQGADVLLYPTAIGGHAEDSAQDHADQLDAWITVQRSHAIANGLFVAAANRIGTEGPNTFWGNSFIADPLGRILAQAGPDQPEILHATLDLAQIEHHRRTWNLFFRDRRPDTYQQLTRRWND